MTGRGALFNWTPAHSNAFKEIKTIVAEDTMIILPNLFKPCVVHTDASNYQIGGVMSQVGKPIAYFSRKFNSSQSK